VKEKHTKDQEKKKRKKTRRRRRKRVKRKKTKKRKTNGAEDTGDESNWSDLLQKYENLFLLFNNHKSFADNQFQDIFTKIFTSRKTIEELKQKLSRTEELLVDKNVQISAIKGKSDQTESVYKRKLEEQRIEFQAQIVDMNKAMKELREREKKSLNNSIILQSSLVNTSAPSSSSSSSLSSTSTALI